MDTETQNSFIDQLKALVIDTKQRNNRGNRAALRRYWSPTTRYQAYPLLGQLGALRDSRKTILAALFAEHPQHKAGQTIAKAALRLDKPTDGKHPYDRHFRRLLACDSLNDLAQQLYRLVKRLQRKGIPLDYESLLINLYTWTKTSEPHKREDVKVRWAADFWQAQIPTEMNEEVIES